MTHGQLIELKSRVQAAEEIEAEILEKEVEFRRVAATSDMWNRRQDIKRSISALKRQLSKI